MIKSLIDKCCVPAGLVAAVALPLIGMLGIIGIGLIAVAVARILGVS